MSPASYKKVFATALAAAALASGLAVSGASAHYGNESPEAVPPPPSLMAASAAEEYEQLRSQYQDLRSPDTRDQADGYAPTLASQPAAAAAAAPSDGFDVPSAAIGAAAGAGLVILALAAAALVRRRPVAREQGAIGA